MRLWLALWLTCVWGTEPVPAGRHLTLEAKRWWNLPTNVAASRPATRPVSTGDVRRAGRWTLAPDRNYVLLFFQHDQAEALRKVIKPLNRLDARREWVVVGLSPDEPNEIAPLVYRQRMRFAIGAGSRDQRLFGVRRLPCVVVVRGGVVESKGPEELEAALATLVEEVLGSEGPLSESEERAALVAEAPLAVLRRIALHSPNGSRRHKAVQMLRPRLEAAEFQELVEEMLAADAPEWWNKDHPHRMRWYSNLALMYLDPGNGFQARHDCLEHIWAYDYGEWTNALEAASRITLDEITPDELEEAYLAHLGSSNMDFMMRRLILERFSEFPADDRVRHYARMIAAEPDVCCRTFLMGMVADGWPLLQKDWSATLLPVLEACLEPEQPLAVRVMAEQMLQMIAESQR